MAESPGVEWLARNKCQTLMFRSFERWETLPIFRPQAALADASSL